MPWTNLEDTLELSPGGVGWPEAGQGGRIDESARSSLEMGRMS